MSFLLDADAPLAAMISFVQTAPVAVALVDRQLVVRAASSGWKMLIDCDFQDNTRPPADAEGRSVPAALVPVIQRAFEGATVAHGSRPPESVRLNSATIGLHVQPLRDSSGAIFAVACFVISGSNQLHAKEDSDTLRNRLRQLTAAMSISIFEYDFATGTSIITDDHLALFSLDKDRLPASPKDWADLLRPVDRAAYWKGWQDAIDSGHDGRVSFEVRPLLNGQERQMELQAHLQFSGEGANRRAERVFGMLIDHTESRRMQEALSRAQRQETVGRMAGMVAHDFNNILTVILANLELAELRAGDPELLQLLRNAADAAEMGASFNKRLVALAGGHRAIVAALPVAVDEHIARTWTVFQRVLSDALTLEFHPGAPNAVVTIDPAEIDGAILNLVMNARDAQPAGGSIQIATSLDLPPSALVRRPQVAGRRFVCISVTDKGFGMSQEVLNHVIEPFYTTKKGGHGNGLGLTSVVLSAERAGGFVEIQSKVGVGTVVSICLPVSTAPAAAIHSKSETYPFGNGELILVVEDDPHVREAVMQRLEAIGYAVLEAANGEVGWQLIQSGEPIDLVLSDVVMPGALSGYDLIRKVKADYPHIATLLTSGHVSAALRDDGEMDPSVTLLSKPYSLREMAEAVARALMQLREET